jgi:hypothetical protein
MRPAGATCFVAFAHALPRFDAGTTIKSQLAGLPAFNLCESGQVGNEAATAK